MRATRHESGQATAEYTALLLVVAIVLAAAAAVVADPGIGRALLDGLRRALCAVTGVSCSADAARRPCVVSGRGRREDASVTVGVVRLGADAALLREVRSDGTVALTLVGGGAGGVELGAGAGLELPSLAFGGELRAAGLARLGGGRTWIAPDARAADALERELGPRRTPLVEQPLALVRGVLGDEPEVREPDITFTDLSTRRELEAGAGGLLRGSLGSVANDVVGLRSERRTGRRTLYLRTDQTAAATLSARLLGRGTANDGGAFTVGITHDRTGEPVEATIGMARTVEGFAQLPAAVRPLVGRGRLAGGARLEADARLDLTDPVTRAAFERFLAAGKRPDRPGELAAAAAALAERIVAAGSLEARAYDVRSRTRRAGGRIRAGPGLGGSVSRRDSTARLLGAWERLPGGSWAERLDCTAAAA